ncbi:hypothetical protein F5Y16DRAFT_401487 [Xylariaceae sp. FL0255]|nr:hypothetical protein F5Y16DRAFT_401487 [Xylariaceae sp. FL0255]
MTSSTSSLPVVDPLKFAGPLSSGLVDPVNEQLRIAVHEIHFGDFDEPHASEMDRRLLSLVESLINLKLVKFLGRISQETLMRLVDGSKAVDLHLLGEDGKRSPTGPLNNVVALAASVGSHVDESEGPNRDILSFQELLFACPNLKSLHLGIHGTPARCMGSFPHQDSGFNFSFSGHEKFPPLEALSLDGYYIEEDEVEWRHWQDKMQWTKLRALTFDLTTRQHS